MEALFLLLEILSLLNVLFAIALVFFGRKNPGATWAWFLVLLFIPYVGFIIYLLIGLDSRHHARFARKALRDEAASKDLPGTLRDVFTDDTNLEENAAFNDLAVLNFTNGGFLTKNNNVSAYVDGNLMYNDLMSDIECAKKFIHLNVYILQTDELAKKLLKILTQKACDGLDVRILIDGMGSRRAALLREKGFLSKFCKCGGKIGIFAPQLFGINFRNHRKIIVLDGITGYIGGLNAGDEYLGLSKRFGHWRDAHLRIEGEAVKALEVRFVNDWNFCSRQTISFDASLFPNLRLQQFNPNISPAFNNVRTQIVSSGPDTKRYGIHYAYIKMITEANKYVYIQTPYFAPDDAVLEALRIAGLSGLDVRIVIPAKPDHPFVYWASLAYLGELLEAGVKCYLYKNGFVHSKLIIIDGFASSVGTANVDMRSFKLNFEINAFMYDKNVASFLTSSFLLDLNDCFEITKSWYDNLGILTQIRQSVSRLLAPIL